MRNPTALDPLYVNRYEVAAFARDAAEIGANYLGVCCGASPMLDRLPDHIVALGHSA